MKQLTIPRILLVGVLAVMLSACSGYFSPSGETAVPLAADIAVGPDAVAPENVAPVVSANNTAVTTAPAQTDNGIVITSETFVNIYEQVNPSVVNIQVLGSSPLFNMPDLPQDHPNIPNDPNNPTDPNTPQPQEEVPSGGQGSGFIYDAQGHIITNNHVVADADKITVIFSDGTEADATVVGTDPASDLAVIQVEGVDAALLRPVTLGDSDSLRVGEIVATIGNPFGLDGSMSTGIIAGVGRLLPSGAVAPGGGRFNIPDIIQTDSVINPGNSGGPLLNLKGEVIGVNTAIATNGFSFQPTFGGVGYVVPSNIVKEVVPQLIENGSIAHPWLGIAGRTLVSAYAEAMNLDPNQHGVLVDEVLPNSPADKAGLVGSNQEVTIDGFPARIGGDVIIQIDDQPILEFDDLLTYIVRQTKPGQTVTLTILRDGEQMQVPVTMEARPEQ